MTVKIFHRDEKEGGGVEKRWVHSGKATFGGVREKNMVKLVNLQLWGGGYAL